MMKNNILTEELEAELLKNSNNGNIIIPDGIQTIREFAFYHNRKIKSIIIPNSVTSIGNYAFIECNRLTSIEIPESVIEIGREAFYHCTNLKSIIIHNPDLIIEFGAFNDCGGRYSKKYNDKKELIAYKGFHRVYHLSIANALLCHGFIYEEGKTYRMTGEVGMCRRGFHACLTPFDCFNHYYGKLGTEVEYHKVYMNGTIKRDLMSSTVVASEITIGEKIDFSKVCI